MKQLLVITTPAFFDGEAEILTRLFREGMARLHIRKPGCQADAFVKLISGIPVIYHRHIVLHDHFELAAQFALHGIHLNNRNPEQPEGFAGSVSRSCHTLDELADLSSCRYAFLSPIFTSISKAGYPQAFSPTSLVEAAGDGRINPKVIALGGINRDTIPRIAHLPFGGVAVLGALWGQPEDIREQALVERYRALRHCLTINEPKG